MAEDVSPTIARRRVRIALREAREAAGHTQSDVAEKMVNAGLIITTESPEFFGRILKTDYEKYGTLVKSIGFNPQ